MIGLVSNTRPTLGGVQIKRGGLTIKIGNITRDMGWLAPGIGGIINGVFITSFASPDSNFSVDDVLAGFYSYYDRPAGSER